MADAIRAVRDDPGAGRRLISLNGGIEERTIPPGFAHDRQRSRLGQGFAAFDAARHAFREWAEFDLGWVRVANRDIPVAIGQLVAVEVHAFGLWSLNLSRIVETVDSDHQFGFVYSTTTHHAEHGEERFLLEYDPAGEVVWYYLEAVSRPRHPLARVAYPATRALQHCFARDSHARMGRAVAHITA